MQPVRKPGIDGQHALLAERRREQQLAQIVGEDANGDGVGALLGLVARLGLHGAAEQSLVAVVHGEPHLLRRMRRCP